MDKSCNNCNNQKSATCIQCHQDWEVAGELTGWNILSNSTCENCNNKLGDGYPYGNVTCSVDGKLRYERSRCNNGKFDYIVSEKDKILTARRCGSCRWWEISSRRCLNLESPLNMERTVLRHQTCGKWDDLSLLDGGTP